MFSDIQYDRDDVELLHVIEWNNLANNLAKRIRLPCVEVLVVVASLHAPFVKRD